MTEDTLDITAHSRSFFSLQGGTVVTWGQVVEEEHHLQPTWLRLVLAGLYYEETTDTRQLWHVSRAVINNKRKKGHLKAETRSLSDVHLFSPLFLLENEWAIFLNQGFIIRVKKVDGENNTHRSKFHISFFPFSILYLHSCLSVASPGLSSTLY